MRAASAAARPLPEPHDAGPAPGSDAPVELFLRLLARAIRNFKLYPVDSSYRTEAIAACFEAHTALRGSEKLSCRVTPCELLIDDVGVGAGTIVEQELARRLHLMQVAELTIECTATARDFSQLCAALVACELRQLDGAALAEQLRERAVDTIVPRVASRPEVLDVDASSIERPPAEILEFEPAATGEAQAPRAEDKHEGTIGYLYPKGKGWVRLDPGASVDSVSITDLATLVDDPRDLSLMLLKLSSDGGTEDIERNAALRLKFDELTMIFSAMRPELGRRMFGKLADSVLALGEEARQTLLKDTVLPGLIEGRSGGQILNDFPDLELADAIGMLLDLETADPGVINAALSKLDLAPERRQSMKPLLQKRFKQRDDSTEPGRPGTDDVLDRFAEKWIKVDTSTSKNFVELSAFDLAFDADVRTALATISDEIESADAVDAKLTALLNLIRISLNPQLTDTFLERFVGVLTAFERAGRWDDLVAAVQRAREIGVTLHESRPDVADMLTQALAKYWTRTRLLRLVQLEERGGEGSATAGRLIEAFGHAMAPSLVALLEDRLDEAKAAALIQMMRTNSGLLAPGLTASLKTCSAGTACVLMEMLSGAGAGFERPIALRLKDEDETVFEAGLQALARIGTPHAAAAVSSIIRTDGRGRALLAENTIWKFPKDVTRPPVCDILRDRDFVVSHPDLAHRLLSRARSSGLQVPRETLLTLSRLMYRVWRPALMRVGLKARRMLGI